MEDVSATDWRKSSYSSNGAECVEAGNGYQAVMIRDTTDRHGGTLMFSTTAWQRFTDQLKND